MIAYKAAPLSAGTTAATQHRVSPVAADVNDPPNARLQRQLFATPSGQHVCHGGLRTRGAFKNDDADHALISIVTIVFNGKQYLEDTILSVLALQDDHVEYIIIDGGSTDGTLDIIRQYEDRIDYWRSEPDQGIADAFNKGVALTRGAWIGCINADDWYEPQALQRLRAAMTNVDVVTGALRCHYPQHALILPSRARRLRSGMFMNHPCCFVRFSVYAAVGGFDASYRLAMDYDFLVRASQLGMRMLDLPDVQANMRMIGISYRQRKLGRKEVWQIKKRFYGIDLIDTFYWMQIRVANNLRNRIASLLRLE